MTFTSTPKGFAASAPESSKAFEQSASPSIEAERSVFIAQRRAEQGQAVVPSTKAELDQLTAQRAAPSSKLILEPNGSIKAEVDQTQRSETEERIRFVQQRLHEAQCRHSRQFKLSR